MSCTASSGLDRSFLVTIKEIERGYNFLSKQQKIRTEKWVEKLVISGVANYVWKKHRNEYAKLLLHMVLLKRLGAPFHILPPDGQLCQFPKHFNSNDLRDKAPHPHQQTFWSEIYSRLTESQANGNASRRYRENLECQYRESLSSNSFYSQDFTQNRSNEREHKLQVDILEQQLQDEKFRYGLHVQKLEHAHKIELSAYAEAVASKSAISNAAHNYLIPTNSNSVFEDEDQSSKFKPFTNHLQQFRAADSHNFDSNLQLGLSDIIGTAHTVPPQQTNKTQPTGLTRSAISDVSLGGSNYDIEITSEFDRRKPWAGFRSYAETNLDTGALDKRDTSRNKTAAASSSTSLSTLPKTDNAYQIDSPVPSRRSKSQAAFDDELACPRRGTLSSIARVSSFGNTSRSIGFSSDDFGRNKTFSPGQNDDDFLAYIEEFQSEIKKLQDSSPMKRI